MRALKIWRTLNESSLHSVHSMAIDVPWFCWSCNPDGWKKKFSPPMMKPARWSLPTKILLLALLPAPAAPLLAQQVRVIEKTLPNRMHLLLVERHDDPTVAGGWVAHVGSANERPGITGIAHLFEHMMFKGTPTLGTRDYKKDLEIIAGQESLREEMRREDAKMREAYRRGDIDDLLKPESKTPRLKELEKRSEELIASQRNILVKNEFDRVYTT